MGLEHLQAQTLQVALSPAPKVNRTTSGGTATIFFDSSIEDLTIICTEENPDEPITKINDHQWFVNIDVNKDLESDGICYRNYLLKCSASAEYLLTTEEIAPNQVLYYTITLPNELEPKFQEEKARNIALKASKLVDEGDSYLARLLALQALPPNLPYTIDSEMALRKASQMNSAIMYGHTESVESASYSPDGNKIVSSSLDHSIRIWNAQTGKCMHTLVGHEGYVWTASFSPNGKNVVSSSYDKTIRIWDVYSGKCLRILNGHSDFIRSAKFSPNGQSIVSASYDGTIRIWDVKTGDCVQMLKVNDRHVNSVEYSPNGKFIISTSGSLSEDKNAYIWDVKTGACLFTLGHKGNVESAYFSPDGEKIVSVSDNSDSFDNIIYIWSAKTGKCIKRMTGHTNRIQSATFSLDGNLIVSASLDKTIRIWNAQTGKCLKVLEGHTNSVNYAAFSPDGKHIVSASTDKTIRIWDLDSRKNILKKLNGSIEFALFSPNQNSILAKVFKGLKVLNANTANLENKLDIEGIIDGVFHVDGKQAIVVTNNISGAIIDTIKTTNRGKSTTTISKSGGKQSSTILLWDVNTGKTNLLTRCPESTNSINISPDGKYIVTTHFKTIRIWDSKTGKCLHTLEGHVDCVNSATFSMDGKRIVSGSIDKTVRIWNVKTGECLRTMVGHTGSITSVIFNPNGDVVASGSGNISGDNTVRIWNANTGECMKILEGHTEGVESVSFCPIDKYILSASWDNSVRIWDINSGKCVLSLNGHTDHVNSAFFSPDGQHIISASDDYTIRVWDFSPFQKLINETRERFKDRQLTPEEKSKYNLE